MYIYTYYMCDILSLSLLQTGPPRFFSVLRWSWCKQWNQQLNISDGDVTGGFPWGFNGSMVVSWACHGLVVGGSEPWLIMMVNDG